MSAGYVKFSDHCFFEFCPSLFIFLIADVVDIDYRDMRVFVYCRLK
jgi:hypothetical protein